MRQARRRETYRRTAVCAANAGGRAGAAPVPPPRSPVTADELSLSLLSPQALHRDDEVDRWIREIRNVPSLRTEIVRLDQLTGWEIERPTGNIVHASGRFFSIVGSWARHRTASGELEWDQPVIDQPEIGILGILAKRIGGVLHFCLQAKEEPGTINAVQLSPTVQATYSNYTRVHGGKHSVFVSYFLDPPAGKVLFSKLQTEDGGRFLFKSNRNMIVLVDENELTSLPEGFIWLTLRQIGQLVRFDNLVNACCRSVLSLLFTGSRPVAGGRPEAGPPRPEPAPRGSWNEYAGVVQWIDDRKAANHILQKRVPLHFLGDWHWDGNGHLVHHRNRYFTIKGLNVSAPFREKQAWSQPILDNVAPGIIGLLVRQGEGGMEYLMQAKAEPGNRSVIQVGPTVQFTQENYQDERAAQRPFLFEEFRRPRRFLPVAESRQSEEGARFFREEHVHRVLLLPPGCELDIPPDYRWLTEDQIRFLLHCGEQVNSCGRSILACLL